MAISASDVSPAYFFCERLAGTNFDIPTHPQGFPRGIEGVTIYAYSVGVHAKSAQLQHWCELARSAPGHPVDCFYWGGIDKPPIAAFRMTYRKGGEK